MTEAVYLAFGRRRDTVIKPKVTELVEEIATPIVLAAGLELVDVEYKKEGSNWYLRVFIDRPDSTVDIDDCGRVSELLSVRLDELDPIPTSYFLEVSSPGAERPLKKTEDYRRAVGHRVYVTTYEPIDGQKIFEGDLIALDDLTMTIEEPKKQFIVPLEKVASARLAVSF